MGRKQQYKFGTKNNWRARVWNRAVSRMAVPPRDAVALYLAGPDDLDRPLAVRKGFDPLNLIAVNDDQEVVDRIRKSGGIAIRGDVFSVLWHWPRTVPLNFVNLDLCCGLQGVALKFGVLSVLQPHRDTGLVVAVNLQRGRDSGSNCFRDVVVDINQRFGQFNVPDTHRGMQFYWMMALSLSGLAKVRFGLEGSKVGLALETVEGEFSRQQAEAVRLCCNPDFYAYKSGVWMDSVLFSLPPKQHYRKVPVMDVDLRQRIIASLAVRTQKKNRRAERSKPTLRVIRAA